MEDEFMKMNVNFLAVNKNYLRMGLKSIDILILSQIEEFQRNECNCYVTNEQFSEMFGESKDTVKRSLNKLEEMNIIERKTSYVEGNGRANRQRIIELNDVSKWRVQNAPVKMEGANSDNGGCKNPECKEQNAPIKEKEKDNIKDNIISEYIPSDEEISSVKVVSGETPLNLDFFSEEDEDRGVSKSTDTGRERDNFMLIDKAKESASVWCIKNGMEYYLSDIYKDIENNRTGMLFIDREVFKRIITEASDNYI